MVRHTPQWDRYPKVDDPQTGASPTGVRVLSPRSGSPAQGFYSSGKMSPRTFGFWKPAGLNFGNPTGVGEIETSLLKGGHEISHTPGPRVKSSHLTGVWARPICPFWSVSQGSVDGYVSPWGHESRRQTYLGTFCREDMAADSFHLSSLVPKPGPTQQPAGNPGWEASGQITNWVGTQPQPWTGPKDFLSP